MDAMGPYVAVVDDEAPVRTALGRLLRLENFEVGAFASGEEFLATLAERRPACVVLDVNMPLLSGFGVLARLKAAQTELPIVFITASDDAEVEQQAQDSGCALLRKPFSNEVLLQAVAKALAKRPGG